MRLFLWSLLGISLILLTRCKKETIYTGSDVQLEFSVDTLMFDTVFTTVGSATRSFKIYNRLNQPVNISKVSLELGSASKYNLNVDGIPGDVVTNVEIGANDSIYVFAEVTIDPDDSVSVSPFILYENLLVETNGNQQSIVLEAWGQNANYIPSNSAAGQIAVLSCDFGEAVWDDPKPYVIYGILYIRDCTLRIQKGTKIYVHGGVALSPDDVVYGDGIIYVGENGSLLFDGTNDEPIIIQGDRLESPFEDISGQWAGIRYATGSLPGSIKYTKILNSTIGVRVDSAAELSLEHVEIRNTSSSGIIGVHATINGTNCLIADNGGYGIQLEYGGDYQFDYVSVANYGNDASALRMGNALCLDGSCDAYLANGLNANFRNCIFFGSQKDEIELFNRTDEVPFNYLIDHSIVRVQDLTKENFYPDFFDHCPGCINGTSEDKVFVNVDEYLYELDSLSIAEKRAIPIIGVDNDLLDRIRDQTAPDIGCYEYQY